MIPGSRYHYYPHFRDKEAEIQRGEVTQSEGGRARTQTQSFAHQRPQLSDAPFPNKFELKSFPMLSTTVARTPFMSPFSP
jgi:hypothetical protein